MNRSQFIKSIGACTAGLMVSAPIINGVEKLISSTPAVRNINPIQITYAPYEHALDAMHKSLMTDLKMSRERAYLWKEPDLL